LAALVGTPLYFFGNLYIWQNGLLLSCVGVAGVVVGLLQLSVFNIPWRPIRSFINAFFAFGAFLVLVGIDEITQSIYIDLFLIVLVTFWLFTRILLSQLDHDKICRRCNAKSCEFRRL